MQKETNLLLYLFSHSFISKIEIKDESDETNNTELDAHGICAHFVYVWVLLSAWLSCWNRTSWDHGPMRWWLFERRRRGMLPLNLDSKDLTKSLALDRRQELEMKDGATKKQSTKRQSRTKTMKNTGAVQTFRLFCLCIRYLKEFQHFEQSPGKTTA